MINKKAKHCWIFFAFLGVTAAMAAITMLLWNALVPVIFGGIAINFLQALGLLVLARVLFGGFGFHHLGRHAHAHFHKGEFPHMHTMSKEERKELIRRHMAVHGFCCNDKDETPEGESTEK